MANTLSLHDALPIFMGYPTKIQRIKRAKSEQWYVNFPSAVAQAIEFNQGEVVEWIIDDHQRLVLKRSDEAVASLKKKLPKKT
jgi:adenylate kinase family enzyme